MKRLLHILFAFILAHTQLFSQCITNVDFNTWTKVGQPANGNWVVQGGGSSVRQTVNGDNTYFVSPFDLMNVKVTGRFRTTDDDDDYMGFVFSFLNPMGPIDDYDCWLFDWKEENQNSAQSGMSINRVLGTIPPSQYNTTFWSHQNTPEFTVVQNTFGGPGWQRNYNHAFELRLTYTRAIIYVDGNLIFDVTDCFKPGRFGFYNFSQEDCYYSNFQYDLFIDFLVSNAGKKCRGDSVSFDFVNPCYQASLAQYQSLRWDFGDGTILVNNNPTFANANVKHLYTTAGNYTATLTVTDFNGCSSVATKQVQIANPISIASTPTQPPCNGGNNGSIQANPSGGFGPYSYTWSTGQTTQTAIGLTAGTYTVTVTDNICTSTAQFTLNQPTPLTASVAKTDANCGLNNGTATVTVSGGTTPYQYVNWPTISSTNVATGLGAGTYIPDFRDANGCSSLLQYNATIASLPCGITSSVSKTDVACFNGTTGSATLTVTGSSGTPNISWSPGGQTGATASNLSAGTYTYSYTDNNAAHAFTGQVTITQPSAAMVAQVSTTPIKCAGSNTGQALASVVSGGVPNYTYVWSNGSGNNPAANNLPPGNISVTITDSKGCTAAATGNVSGAASLAVSIATTQDSCFNSAKGKAIATTTGGTPPYDYEWSNFVTSDSNLNIRSGTYTLTVTDLNACTTTGTATITTNPVLGQTFVREDVKCFGQSTGSFNVSITGGVPGYNIAWSQPGLTGTNPTNLASGIYFYTITDAHNCRTVGGDTIEQPDSALTANTSHTDVTCNGLNNGTITVTTSGGTPPYTFLGNPLPAGTITIPSLAPNTYAGNIIDSNGCTFAVSEVITEPAVLSLTETHTNVGCNGQSSGGIDITASGGTTPYSFAWNDGVLTEDRTNIVAGSYSVTVTDANNCTATISVTITEPAILGLTETHTNVGCNGQSSGGIDIAASGGAGTNSFAWSDGVLTEDRTNIAAGSYSVTVTDANNCTATTSVTISEPAALTASTSHTDVTCNGLNNGTITVTTSGGTPPYTFLGNPLPAGTITIPSLAPNTYAGNIIDSNGCTFAVSEVITEPAVLSLTETHTNVGCNGQSTGGIDITASGGTTPYSFAWNDGVLTEDRTNIVAGSYSVTVTDANNCTATISVTITEPAVLSLTETHTNVGCNGQSTGGIDIAASGGAGTNSFAWNDGVLTEDRTNIAAGSYSVTVTDANNCTATTSVTISEPAALTASTSHTDVTCNGLNNGTITVTTSGGTPPYTFLGNPLPAGTITIPSLAPNTYAGNIIDSNGCTFAVSEVITEPTVLSVAESHVDVACYGGSTGSIAITVGGGSTPYSFAWNDGVLTEDRTNISAGNYSVTVTDANNCTATISATITEPGVFALAETHTNVGCNGQNTGSIDVVTNGGVGTITYLWSSSEVSEDITGKAAGNYCVTATDANTCTATLCVAINEPAALVATTSHTDVTCFGLNNGSITINVSGGTAPYSFLGNAVPAGSSTIPNLAPNTYAGVLIDSNNCSASLSETIVEPTQLAATEVHTDASCNGNTDGSITLTVTGGTTPYTFDWGGGVATQNRTSLTAGNYNVTVTDANNCTATVAVTITEPAAVPLTVAGTDATCFGASGSATATPAVGTAPYSFVWSASVSTTATAALVAGTHSVTATSAEGCKQTGTVTINEPTEIVATETHADAICFGTATGSVDVNASGGTGSLSYQWQPNVSSSNTASNLAAGTYVVVVSDANNCSKTVTAVVAEPLAVSLTTTATNVSCFGLTDGAITAVATGGNSVFNYVATGNAVGSLPSQSGSFSNLPADSYSVVATDANGCTAMSFLTITSPTEITVTTTITDVTCHKYSDGSVQAIAAGGSPGYNFKFSTGENNVSGLFSNLVAGSYLLTVTDQNNCSTTTSAVVVEPDSLMVTALPSPTQTPLGVPVQLNVTTNQSGTINYTWIPSTGLSCSTCDNPVFDGVNTVTYTVFVSTSLGCSGSSEITAVVVPDYTVYVPNAFSPNNDGVNDYLQVYGNLKAVKTFDLKVYNRWGEKVYESDDVNFRWDGYGGGKKLPVGVYVYTIKYVFIDNHSNNSYKGSITILE